jgi:hypothetical protein
MTDKARRALRPCTQLPSIASNKPASVLPPRLPPLFFSSPLFLLSMARLLHPSVPPSLLSHLHRYQPPPTFAPHRLSLRSWYSHKHTHRFPFLYSPPPLPHPLLLPPSLSSSFLLSAAVLGATGKEKNGIGINVKEVRAVELYRFKNLPIARAEDCYTHFADLLDQGPSFRLAHNPPQSASHRPPSFVRTCNGSATFHTWKSFHTWKRNANTPPHRGFLY